jgi:hypothetical protein
MKINQQNQELNKQKKKFGRDTYRLARTKCVVGGLPGVLPTSVVGGPDPSKRK